MRPVRPANRPRAAAAVVGLVDWISAYAPSLMLPCLARSKICQLRLRQLSWIYREQMRIGHIGEVQRDEPIGMTSCQTARPPSRTDVSAGDKETVIAVDRH